ncbi:hypothetical protein HMN09_00125900 [Mycena chlorophos]|uniref:Uncharacterized protein n=1 Tax=Mycena chlorophos TaxID=658473 RepID=A0A8H6TQL9_MYCCL|nr:hypothetical protein HMN09_00125900 [Mycena chlorophos]
MKTESPSSSQSSLLSYATAVSTTDDTTPPIQQCKDYMSAFGALQSEYGLSGPSGSSTPTFTGSKRPHPQQQHDSEATPRGVPSQRGLQIDTLEPVARLLRRLLDIVFRTTIRVAEPFVAVAPKNLVLAFTGISRPSQ